YQPTLEKLLRKKLSGAPNFQEFLLHDVYAVEQDGSGVTVRAEDTVSNQLIELRARYVVGCDGARSLVRRLIGTEPTDLGFKQRGLVVNVKPARNMGFEPVSIQHCNPARPAYASGSSQSLRWEFMVLPGESTHDMLQHENVWNLIEQSVRPMRRED